MSSEKAEPNTSADAVVLQSAKGKSVKLTRREIDMLIDAANRMICDDVWDQYSMADEKAIESAACKLGELL